MSTLWCMSRFTGHVSFTVSGLNFDTNKLEFRVRKETGRPNHSSTGRNRPSTLFTPYLKKDLQIDLDYRTPLIRSPHTRELWIIDGHPPNYLTPFYLVVGPVNSFVGFPDVYGSVIYDTYVYTWHVKSCLPSFLRKRKKVNLCSYGPY